MAAVDRKGDFPKAYATTRDTMPRGGGVVAAGRGAGGDGAGRRGVAGLERRGDRHCRVEHDPERDHEGRARGGLGDHRRRRGAVVVGGEFALEQVDQLRVGQAPAERLEYAWTLAGACGVVSGSAAPTADPVTGVSRPAVTASAARSRASSTGPITIGCWDGRSFDGPSWRDPGLGCGRRAGATLPGAAGRRARTGAREVTAVGPIKSPPPPARGGQPLPLRQER